MNKKYKPPKPIVYDIDRSLLHTASRNILNAINNDTIIGQPTFHNKPIKIGTEKVQVGTEKVQVGTERVQVGTEKVQVGTKKVQVGTINHEYNISYKAVYNTGHSTIAYWTRSMFSKESGFSYKILSGSQVLKNLPTNKATVIGNSKNAAAEIYYNGTYIRTLSGKSGGGANQVYSEPIYENQPVYEDRPVYGDQPVYEDRPVYENRPVYKDSPIKGLIMYLRRKGA